MKLTQDESGDIQSLKKNLPIEPLDRGKLLKQDGEPFTSISDLIPTPQLPDHLEWVLDGLPEIQFDIYWKPTIYHPCAECGNESTVRYVFRDGTYIYSCEGHRVDSCLE